MLVATKGLGSAGSSVGVATGGAIASAGALVSGTVIGLPAGAVLAAVGGLVALGSVIAGALHIGEGCGPTCVQATQIVNQVEPVMLDNLHSYQSGQMDQGTALHNYDQLWTVVEQSCGAIPGAAGENCVSDRKAGACKWHDANGQCWNWDIGYRQPLLVSNGVTGNAGGIDLSSFTSNPMLLVGAGVLVLGLMMGGKE